MEKTTKVLNWSRTSSHIKDLLDETGNYHLNKLKNNRYDTSILKEAVDLAPCFRYGTYGMDYFPLVLGVIRYTESETMFECSSKTGNKYFRSAVAILTDVAEDGVQNHLKTRENAAPKLVHFTTDDKIERSFIAGDETAIK